MTSQIKPRLFTSDVPDPGFLAEEEVLPGQHPGF